MLRKQYSPDSGVSDNGAAPAEIAIDMAALSAPEGATKDQIDLLRVEGDNILAAPKEPVKSTEEITADLAIKNAGKKPGDEGYEAPVAPKPAVAGKELYQTVFDKLKTYTENQDIMLPDDINDDNFIEKLAEAVYANTEFPAGEGRELHPSVQRLQDLIDSKVPYEDAIKQLNINSNINTVPAKDLMQNYLKDTFGKSDTNPTGWDDTKINETLEKMDKSGTLELEAERIRHSLREYAETENRTLTARTQQQEDTRITTANKQLNDTRMTLQKEMSAKILEYNDVLGVPVSKAEMQEYLSDFLYLTTPSEDGIAPGAKLLQSNDNYAKALYLLTRGDTKIKGAISEAKNKTKIDWLKKLDLEPQLSTKVPEHGQNVIDLDLMEKPESFVTFKP